MKYNYNKDFRKIAFKLPFSKLICFLSQTSLIIIIKFIKPPKNLTVRNFYINGFENQKILVKEISPELPNDFALLVLHGGGFGYKTAPHQLTNAFEYSTKLNCKSYLVDYHLLPSFDYPVTDNSMTTTSMKTFIDTPLWNTRNNQRMWMFRLKERPRHVSTEKQALTELRRAKRDPRSTITSVISISAPPYISNTISSALQPSSAQISHDSR